MGIIGAIIAGLIVWEIIGVIVIRILIGPNETGTSGNGCTILGLALIWPIILLGELS